MIRNPRAAFATAFTPWNPVATVFRPIRRARRRHLRVKPRPAILAAGNPLCIWLHQNTCPAWPQAGAPLFVAAAAPARSGLKVCLAGALFASRPR